MDETDVAVAAPSWRKAIIAAASVLAFATIMVALHLVSARLWTGALWGAHFWAFLPAWACAAMLAVTVVAALPLTRWIVAAARETGRVDGGAGATEGATGTFLSLSP